MDRPDRSQKEFDTYIASLPYDDLCKYADPLSSIALFCNCLYRCRYKNKIPLMHRGTNRFECNRQKFMKLRRLL